MHKVNLLLSLLSLTALLVIIERISPTTEILLQPYNFLRLHEVVQMTVIIFIGIIISFFLLKEISNNFENIRDKKGTICAFMFIIGLYFYSTGNGVHELASFLFNTYCNIKQITGNLCNGLFLNDYYFGNGLYFIGLLLINLSLILLEKRNPLKNTTKMNTIITLANSLLFTVALVAYAAFDRVSMGLFFLIIAVIIAILVIPTSKIKIKYLPFTLYCVFAYSTAAVISFVIRLVR